MKLEDADQRRNDSRASVRQVEGGDEEVEDGTGGPRTGP